MTVGIPHKPPPHQHQHHALPSQSQPRPHSSTSPPRCLTPVTRPVLCPCCWTWAFLQASRPPRVPGGRRCAEALSHPHQEYHAPLLAPQAPHARHLWASSADLGPLPSAAASTPGALCQLAHGLHPCPHHSLRPDGHPGHCSQIQIPSGTPHLPTPSGKAPRTTGRRPKTWVPRPRGRQRRDLEWARPLFYAPAAFEEPQRTLEWEPGRPLQLPVSPRDPAPRGSGTLHCTASLHTGWGTLLPTHTCDLKVPLTYLPHWGLTLYSAG